MFVAVKQMYLSFQFSFPSGKKAFTVVELDHLLLKWLTFARANNLQFSTFLPVCLVSQQYIKDIHHLNICIKALAALV